MHICCTDMYYGHSSAVVAPITCRTPENYGKPCHKGKIHLLNLPCFGKILCSRQVAVWKYMRYKLQYPIGPRSQNEMMVLRCSRLLFNGKYPGRLAGSLWKHLSNLQTTPATSNYLIAKKNIFRQKTPKKSVTKTKKTINKRLSNRILVFFLKPNPAKRINPQVGLRVL